MDDNTRRNSIADLEARIEALAESLEWCRKIALASRLLIVTGAVWVLLMVVGAIPVVAFHIVGSIVTGLGGIVLFGSNASTRTQAATALAQAETYRAELIGTIDLQTVEEAQFGPRLLH